MAIGVNLEKAGFVSDYVKLVDKVNPSQTLIGDLGLFKNDFRSSKNITIERDSFSTNIIPAENWDNGHYALKREGGIALPLEIPRYPVKDAIRAADLYDKLVAVSDPSQMIVESVSRLRAEKVTKMVNALDHTLEADRFSTLITGSPLTARTLQRSYGDWNIYTELGVAQNSENISLNTSMDITSTLNDVYNYTRDNLTQGFGQLVVLCGRNLFNSVISNEYYQAALIAGAPTTLDKIMGRPTVAMTGTSYRAVEFQGYIFVDASSSGYYNGAGAFTKHLADDDGYVVPMGDFYRTFYSPKQDFDSINSTAREKYFREFLREDRTAIEIFGESNFLNVLLYPEAITKLVGQA